jgi:redox-sensitive bicupin YhaK (pirin superfamily)
LNKQRAREPDLPAITVPDLTVLPHLPALASSLVTRPVVSITTAPSSFEGLGFPVKRAFAGVDLALLDPFIHLDEMGAVEYAPGEPKGTPWHPHRGFETVTYIIDGIFDHQDSFGGGGTITNGDTQWMTAGRGIRHIEAPPEHLVVSGGLFHGFQLWVNLPRSHKLIEPRYQDLHSGEVVLISSRDGSSLLRVIAGEVAGYSGPGATHTPMAMVHATVAPGGRLELPWRRDFNALVYVSSGDGSIGPRQSPLGTGQLAVLGAGDVLTLSAAASQQASFSSGMEVLVLGGAPIHEPIAWAGPFVMNTRAELIVAFDDYNAGRLGYPASHRDLGGGG